MVGAGAGRRLSAVHWGVAGNLVTAWLLTLPAAAAVGAAVYGFTSIFGSGVVGTVLTFLLAVAAGLWLSNRRLREGQSVPQS